MIYASKNMLAKLKQHAKDCFPEECCGLFRCEEKDDGLEITEVIRTKNVSRHKKIGAQIPKRIFRKFSRMAGKLRSKGIYYGVYHSHPLTGSLNLSDQDVHSSTIYKLFKKQLILGIKKENSLYKVLGIKKDKIIYTAFWENKKDKTWERSKIYVKKT